MKGAGILVVSLRGAKFEFRSHLGPVLGKTPLHLAVKVSLRVALSGLGVKKAWATPRLVFFRGLIQNSVRRAFLSLSYGNPTPPPPTPSGISIRSRLLIFDASTRFTTNRTTILVKQLISGRSFRLSKFI